MLTRSDLKRFIYETGSPFKRLEALLDGVQPNPDLEPIIMTVGEPRHRPPQGLLDEIKKADDHRGTGFGKYPPIIGSPSHRAAIAAWLTRRYDLADDAVDPDRHIMPLNGSREGLVFAARNARDLRPDIADPVIVMQNPFYQAYAAGALMADCEVALLDETDQTGTSIDPSLWNRVVAAVIASPTNPQGEVLLRDQWSIWIDRARSSGFYLFADECYSEIYRDTPPVGALQAASANDRGFDNIISFNSLSKRSNVPGLRIGFAAGDANFMRPFMRLRNMGGPQIPLPLQAAATAAWNDEKHVDASRARYQAKWSMVETHLGPHLAEPLPSAGFFLWLKLPQGDADVPTVRRLWQDHSVKTIPGSYIAYPQTGQSASSRIRLALVDDEATTEDALARIATLFAH